MCNLSKLLVSVLVVFAIFGCSGTRTFHDAVKAGDTVVVAAGWMHTFSRDNITVRILTSAGDTLIFPPNDPIIRAVTNMYIDPLASIVVSRQTGQNLTPDAQLYAGTMQSITGDDKDWWQTVVFLDLPETLPVGATRIRIRSPEGEVATSYLDIVSAGGQPNPLSADGLGPMIDEQIVSMERVAHNTVSFTGGDEVPYAIQIDIQHYPDADNGGTGRAYVVNPIGYIKNASWSDDGENLRVILMPARDNEITSRSDFKFYIAGGITGLFVPVDGVQAFNRNGDIIPGVAANID
jgi:hypothetical protein